MTKETSPTIVAVILCLPALPMGELVEPEQAAHFVATLIDGVGTGQTGQFFSIDNGWAFM